MSWLTGLLGSIWSALTGRERVPRTHDELFRYAGSAGDSVGRIEGQAGQPLTGDPPIVEVAAGLVKARIASISQRLARKLKRLLAKADRQARKAERHEAVAKEARAQLPEVEPMTHAVIDFFASRVWIYLAGFVLIVLTLEATGMLTSLISYEAVLGRLRLPMSLAAGAILVGAGHGAGHLIHSSLGGSPRARAGYLGGAAAVLLIGVVAVAWLGSGREVNSKAADDFAAVGVLEGEAGSLDGRAEDLLKPIPEAIDGKPLPKPSAEDRKAAHQLQRQANTKRREAALLDAQARDERTFSFFIPVQILGLAVGAIGGFFFAAAAPTREHRRLTGRARRSERRATRHRGRELTARAKAVDVEAAVGRLGEEEDGWREVSLGHHEQRRLLARKGDASIPRRAAFDIDERILRALDAPNRNGGRPEPVPGGGTEE